MGFQDQIQDKKNNNFPSFIASMLGMLVGEEDDFLFCGDLLDNTNLICHHLNSRAKSLKSLINGF